MNADQPSGQKVGAATPAVALARWAELLAEMSELHAKLEYVNLMLRLGSPGKTSDR
jgi:hypothetical protein